MRTSLIIPTRNASSHLARLLPALRMQTLQPDEMLVVDSASSDDTVARFREFGARVEVIDARDFNHGGTRRWASEQVSGDALIVMTQDAIPATPETFANLLAELQRTRSTAWRTAASYPTPMRVCWVHNRGTSTTPTRPERISPLRCK
jgi:rhamnosyltransferase